MNLSFVQIDRYSLNNSKSKQQFSFRKQPRFKRQNSKFPKLKFYTLPSTLSIIQKKGPAFPKTVRKMQFPTQKVRKSIPSPSTYSLKSDIEMSFRQKRGISITKSMRNMNKKLLTPGPSDYSPVPQIHSSSKYSISKQRKKLEYPLEMQKGIVSPGPKYLVDVAKLKKIVCKYEETKCMKVYSSVTLRRKTKWDSELKNPQHSSKKIKEKQQKQSEIRNKKEYLGLQSKSKKMKQNSSLNVVQRSKEYQKGIKGGCVLGRFNKSKRKTIFQQKSICPGPNYNYFSEFARLQKKIFNQKMKSKNLKLKKLNNG